MSYTQAIYMATHMSFLIIHNRTYSPLCVQLGPKVLPRTPPPESNFISARNSATGRSEWNVYNSVLASGSDGRNQIAIRFNRDLNRNEYSIQTLRDLVLIRFIF